MLKFDSRFNVLYFTYFKPIYRSTLIRRANISGSRNRMVRGGGKEGRRKRHANVVRLPPFPLVEVVRPTIAARMWSIVSSHRTTCMTHFRVHVYRLTWNIYSNRLTEHNPIRPSVSLSLTSRRIVLDIHPFLLLLSHLHLSSLYFQYLIIFNPFCNIQSLYNRYRVLDRLSSKIFSPSIFHSISRYLPLESASLPIKFLAGRTIFVVDKRGAAFILG